MAFDSAYEDITSLNVPILLCNFNVGEHGNPTDMYVVQAVVLLGEGH